MSYTANEWLPRLGTGLNKYTDQNGNTYAFTSTPDSVTQEGTPFSAAWMNHIEDGIETVDGYFVNGVLQPSAGGTGVNSLSALIDFFYPVGTVYESTNGTNPSVRFGVGTWVPYGEGRVSIGVKSDDPDFNAANKTGGSKTHTNTVPSHYHTLNGHIHTVSLPHVHGSGTLAISRIGSIGGAVAQGDFAPVIDGSTSIATVSGNTGGPSTNSTGTKSAFATNAASSLPPYITSYKWERIA